MSDDVQEPEIIPPRPRGRPRKNAAGPDPVILDAAGEGPADAKTRKPGGRQSKADKIARWAEDIQGVHELAAVMLQMPMLRLEPEAAMKLAQPAYETAAKYGWEGGVGPELRLLFAAGCVYGPMAFQVNMEILRRKAEAAKTASTATQAAPEAEAEQAPGNIYNFDPNMPDAAEGY